MARFRGQYFTRCRVQSSTRPDDINGLPEVISFGKRGLLTRADIEALTAEDLGFHIESESMQSRGSSTDEEFVLIALDLDSGGWELIKSISPAPGKGPDYDDAA